MPTERSATNITTSWIFCGFPPLKETRSCNLSHKEVGKSCCRAGRWTLPHNTVQNIFVSWHTNRMHKFKESRVCLSPKETDWRDIRHYSMSWQKTTGWQPSLLSAELLVSLWLLVQAPWEGRDKQMINSYTFALGVHEVHLTVPSYPLKTHTPL